MATIQGIYIALFGRPADPVGLKFFNTATGNGANLNAIGDLASTPEYQSRFQGLDSTEIVTAIYQSLFARNPEEEGLTFFINALAAGTFNINNVAIAILDGAQGPDLDIVKNKIAAANIFTAAIDTADELAAYRGNDASDAGRSFITVTADDGTIPTTADADTVLAGLTSGPPPSSQFVLTDGFDTANTAGAFTNGGPGNPGTAANFLFTTANESVIATTATLGRSDSLVDGSTADSDRLQLTLTGDTIFPVVTNIEVLELTANTSAASTINLALVTGAKSLDLGGLLIGPLTIADIANTGITVVDGSGLASSVPTNGFIVDFSASTTVFGAEITGSAANDTLTGSGSRDIILGGDGEDTLVGGGGNDDLDGGAGNDDLSGGAGNDDLVGGAGADFLAAGGGVDSIVGGAGDDTIALVNDSVALPGAGDKTSDAVFFEATAADNGVDQIFFFEASGADPDKLRVTPFLGEPVSFFAFSDGLIGKGGMGFETTGKNVIILTPDPDVDTLAELTDAIGTDPSDLSIGANARAVIAMQQGETTFLFFVTTDDNNQPSDVSLVGTLSNVATSELTAANFF